MFTARYELNVQNIRQVKFFRYTTTYTSKVNHGILLIYLPPTKQKYSSIIYYNAPVYADIIMADSTHIYQFNHSVTYIFNYVDFVTSHSYISLNSLIKTYSGQKSGMYIKKNLVVIYNSYVRRWLIPI